MKGNKMAITDIRVVQVWDISSEGDNVPVTHFFEVQRDGNDKWEALEIYNALRRDHRQQEGQGEHVAENASQIQ